MPSQPAGQLTCIDLGRMEYAAALAVQQRHVAQVKDSPEKAYMLLVEHDPPVITLGRASDRGNIVAGAPQLAAAGVEVHETSRGGEVTYHGPGQIVGYPILRIDRDRRGLHGYLRDLEEVLIRTLGRFGLAAMRIPGLTGVWVGGQGETSARPGPRENNEKKVAAIGVAVTRWVSYHGFAINVCCDLSHYDLIVPCGIGDRGVTSISDLLPREVAVAEVKPVLIECFAEVFAFDDVRGEKL